MDHAAPEWILPIRAALQERFFRDGQATSDLLATIAGSIITVTSITFSLLLLAVQQAASSLTHQVYDQFLRRRINQIYFGSFIGVALYTLIILATVDRPYNPVIGATLALLFAIVALTLLILLLYTTINQMRPGVVIGTIHNHILIARARQQTWLRRTRTSPQLSSDVPAIPVKATTHGYVVEVDVDVMGTATNNLNGEVEIVLRVPIGSFVAFHDTLAEVRAPSSMDVGDIARVVQKAIRIEAQRDLDNDPAYGIEQLAIIGWTSVSTAKSNPSPGLLVLHSLRDVLARWSAEQNEEKAGQKGAVVYSDNVFAQLLEAFETLAVVASESMQPQTMAEIVRTFATMFGRIPVRYQPRMEDIIRRSLSALGDHVLIGELNTALSDLTRVLDAAGRPATATRVRTARDALDRSTGKLGSRATRAAQATAAISGST